MKIQLIEKQPFVFRANEDLYLFVKPKYLYKNCNEQIKAVAKGGTFGWNIQGEHLSYNRLKKLYRKS